MKEKRIISSVTTMTILASTCSAAFAYEAPETPNTDTKNNDNLLNVNVDETFNSVGGDESKEIDAQRLIENISNYLKTSDSFKHKVKEKNNQLSTPEIEAISKTINKLTKSVKPKVNQNIEKTNETLTTQNISNETELKTPQIKDTINNITGLSTKELPQSFLLSQQEIAETELVNEELARESLSTSKIENTIIDKSINIDEIDTDLIEEFDEKAYNDSMVEWRIELSNAQLALDEANIKLDDAQRAYNESVNARDNITNKLEANENEIIEYQSELNALPEAGHLSEELDAALENVKKLEQQLTDAQYSYDVAVGMAANRNFEFEQDSTIVSTSQNRVAEAQTQLEIARTPVVEDTVKSEVDTQTLNSRILGQAISEQINTYREVNDRHKLVTSVQMINDATQWSKIMKDHGKLVHSTSIEWGRSGENIAATYSKANLSELTNEELSELATKAFSIWYKSDNHNKNMLTTQYQAFSVGVYQNTETNKIWLTTMFYNDKVPVSIDENVWYPASKTFTQVKNSDNGFYTPASIIERLGGNLDHITVDTRNHEGYEALALTKDEIDLTDDYTTGVDPYISPIEVEPTIDEAAVSQAELDLELAQENLKEALIVQKDSEFRTNSYNEVVSKTEAEVSKISEELENAKAEFSRIENEITNVENRRIELVNSINASREKTEALFTELDNAILNVSLMSESLTYTVDLQEIEALKINDVLKAEPLMEDYTFVI